MDVACSGTRAVSCGVVSVQALAFVSAERFENRFELAPRDLTDRVARCADEVAAVVAFRCVLISVTTAPGARSLCSDLIHSRAPAAAQPRHRRQSPQVVCEVDQPDHHRGARQTRAAQQPALAEQIDARKHVFDPRARFGPAMISAFLRGCQRPVALRLVYHAQNQTIVLAAPRRGRRAVGRVGVWRLAALGDADSGSWEASWRAVEVGHPRGFYPRFP